MRYPFQKQRSVVVVSCKKLWNVIYHQMMIMPESNMGLADDNDTFAGQSSNTSLNDIYLLKSRDINNGKWDNIDIDSAVSDIINNDDNVGTEQHIINNVTESNETENFDESSDINSNCTEYNKDVEMGQFEDASENPDVERRIPLYERCNLTKEENKLLILSFTLRHSLSDLGLSHLLQLIDCHLPHVQYKSKYLFCKDFETPVPVRKIYYCQDCETNILEFEDNAAIARCKDCGNEYNKDNLKRKGHYFMYLPLTDN